MDMQFRSPNTEGALWHQRSLERMRRALRRMHGAVAQVRVDVAVVGEEPVAVTATARYWQASIDAATTVLRQRLLSRQTRASQAGPGAAPPLAPRPAAARAPLRLQPTG